MPLRALAKTIACVILLLLTSSRANAQCPARDTDAICGSTCEQSGCSQGSCYCTPEGGKGFAETGSNFLGSLHPGFVLAYVNGHVEVGGVIPGSPAERAGVLPGDRIISVNHDTPFQPKCVLKRWQNARATSLTVVTFQRGDVTREISIPLVPVREFILAAWQKPSSGRYLRNVAAQSEPDRGVQGAFLFGLSVRSRVLPIISDVMLGSAAFAVGLREGDRILAIGGKQAVGPVLDQLAPSDVRSETDLTIERESERFVVRLRSTGLTDILRNLANSREWQKSHSGVRVAGL